MTQNTLGDLNNHLFAELERLGDEGLTSEQLEQEIIRARALSDIAKRVISNGELVLKAEKFKDERLDANGSQPRMLEG